MSILSSLFGPGTIGNDPSSLNVIGKNIPTSNTGASSVGAFDINGFRSKINSLGGIAKNNLFRVEIDIPNGLSAGQLVTTETLTFFCTSASFPGVRIASRPVQRYGIGPMESMPIGFEFNEMELNFLGDNYGVILQFFAYWTRGIVEYTSGNVYNAPSKINNPLMSPSKPYYINYKQNYETTVTIVGYTPHGDQIYSVQLVNAFPIDLGSIQLNWSQNDQIMVIPLRISFKDVNFIPNSQNANPSTSTGLSLFQSLVKGVTVAQSVQSIFSSQPKTLGQVSSTINNTSNLLKGIF